MCTLDCSTSLSQVTLGDIAVLSARYIGRVCDQYRNAGARAFGGGVNDAFSATYLSKGMISDATAKGVLRADGEWSSDAISFIAEKVACDPLWWNCAYGPCNKTVFMDKLNYITGVYSSGQSNLEMEARATDNDDVLFPVKVYSMARCQRPTICYEHDLPPDTVPFADAATGAPAAGASELCFDGTRLIIIANNVAEINIPLALRGTIIRKMKLRTLVRGAQNFQRPDANITVTTNNKTFRMDDCTNGYVVIGETITLPAAFNGWVFIEGLFTRRNFCDYYTGSYAETVPRYSHYGAMLEHIPKGCESAAATKAFRGYQKLMQWFIDNDYITAANAVGLLAINGETLWGPNAFTALSNSVWNAGKAGEAKGIFAMWYAATLCLLYDVYMYETQVR